MKRRDDGVDVQGKSPGFWFYPADYERDVQILSLLAQGLWIRMLSWMHFCEHRGYLELPTGDPMSPSDIAARVGKSEKDVARAIAEMSRIGLFSKDERGCIFSRRMVKDTHITIVRKQAAAARASGADRKDNGTFAGGFDPAKPEFAPPKDPAKNGPIGILLDTRYPAKPEQNTVPSDSVSDSVSSSDSPKGKEGNADREFWDAHNSFDDYWELFVSAGKALNEADKRKAMGLWIDMPEEEQRVAFKDAHAKALDGTWPSARLTPMPYSHLSQKPWTRVALGRTLPTQEKLNGSHSKLEAARKSIKEVDLSDVESAYK